MSSVFNYDCVKGLTTIMWTQVHQVFMLGVWVQKFNCQYSKLMVVGSCVYDYHSLLTQLGVPPVHTIGSLPACTYTAHRTTENPPYVRMSGYYHSPSVNMFTNHYIILILSSPT